MSGALTPAGGPLLTGRDLHFLLFCVEQTRQPLEWRSFISPTLLPTPQRTNLRGKGCVCLTRWSFFGFLYVLKWLTAESRCSFHTDLLISGLWAGKILVLRVLRSGNISWGSAWADGRHENTFFFFAFFFLVRITRSSMPPSSGAGGNETF